MSRLSKLIDWPYLIGLLFLLALLAGLALLVGWVDGVLRYDPAYFDEPYLSRYEAPSPLLADLENALRTGDAALLAELQGTRWPAAQIEKLPNVRFLIYWDDDKEYSDYLFMDMKNYHRYMQHLKAMKGRYVVVPDGLYYAVDSGSWIRTFGPLAVVWWLVLVLFTLGVWFYRWMAAVRAERYGPRAS